MKENDKYIKISIHNSNIMSLILILSLISFQFDFNFDKLRIKFKAIVLLDIMNSLSRTTVRKS